MRWLASVALAGMATAATSQSTTFESSPCHDYVLVSIRGTGEAQGPSIGLTQMISQTLSAVPNGIEYDVVYPAARNQSFQFGSADALRFINAGLESCPKQRYALLGYSQGASAIMGALMNYTDTKSSLYKALKAIVVIGNPYHVPNASVNVDQFGGSTTRTYGGGLYRPDTPGAMGIPDVYYHDGKLLDICFQADIVCATMYPNASFVAHIGYIGDAKVQSMGAEHIISRLNNAKGEGSNGTVPANATATMGSTSSAGPFATASPSPITPTGAAAAAGGRVSGALFAGVLALAACVVL